MWKGQFCGSDRWVNFFFWSAISMNSTVPIYMWRISERKNTFKPGRNSCYLHNPYSVSNLPTKSNALAVKDLVIFKYL